MHAISMNEREESDIVYEILAYLAENPDAGDTMEGIVEWWLLEHKIKRETGRVREALKMLVEKDLVQERGGKNLRTYYRINQGKYEEIKELLKARSK